METVKRFHRLESVFDHTGREFATLKEMCNFWGIRPGTYLERIRSGWPQEKALTTKTRHCYRTVNVLDAKPVPVPRSSGGEARMTVKEIKKLIKGLDDNTELLILTALPV